MSDEWTVTRGAGTIKHEWNGYIIVSTTNSIYRWRVIQGNPAPFKEWFEYINDAKEACETAYRI